MGNETFLFLRAKAKGQLGETFVGIVGRKLY